MSKKPDKQLNIGQKMQRLRLAYARFKVEIKFLKKRQSRIINNILKRTEEKKIEEIKRNLS